MRKSVGIHDDDMLDEDEMEGLVSRGSNDIEARNVNNANKNDEDPSEDLSPKKKSNKKPKSYMFCWLAIGCISLLTARGISESVRDSNKQQKINVVQFQCPATLPEAENVDDSFDEDYNQVSQQITNNMTEFAENFRETKFDAWGRPYNEIKQGMYEWKSTYYPPYLKNGSSIYESACGIGLNLYMTLEIIQETSNIQNLVVHGNEYVASSVVKANQIMSEIPPAGAQLGTICPGDSSNLHFVPSNSFDLVFTGYISSLTDPLNFGRSSKENWLRYGYLCDAEKSNWPAKELLKIAQRRQADWFALWISELVRIAKPGAPVIIEQVMKTYCSNRHDWDGVDPDWWVEAVDTYGWDVNVKTIQMQKDKIMRDRYHVFMMKNDVANSIYNQ